MSVPGVPTDGHSNHNGSTSRLSLSSLGAHPTTGGAVPSDITESLSSSEDGIKKSLIIDMKDLVGDAVGNVRYPHLRPLRFFPHPDIDEHKTLIPRPSSCCVRPFLDLSFMP